MNGLHALVMAGKVLYLVCLPPPLVAFLDPHKYFVLQGISDAPSWIVTRANQYARDHGKTPFCIYQGMWSVIHRDLERDIIPMVKSEGMALAPFNVLASGKIRSDEQERQRRETGEKGECRMAPTKA